MNRFNRPALAAGIAFLIACPAALAQNGWEEDMDGDEPPVPVPLDPMGGGWPEPTDPGLWDKANGGLSGANDIANPNDDDFQDAIPIFISDVANWSILTQATGGSDFDTVLWLFDANGKAIGANDNMDSTSAFSQIGAEDGLAVTAPGIYWIIISGAGTEPIDDLGIPVFGPGAPTDVLTPGSASPTNQIDGWFGTGETGDYMIMFEGIRGVTASDLIPAPSAALALIGAGLFTRRRR